MSSRTENRNGDPENRNGDPENRNGDPEKRNDPQGAGGPKARETMDTGKPDTKRMTGRGPETGRDRQKGPARKSREKRNGARETGDGKGKRPGPRERKG